MKPGRRKRTRNRANAPESINPDLLKPACVGMYLDALDSKMRWAEAKIIACNVDERQVRVHFIGYKDRHDLWVDNSSIAAHGAYVSPRAGLRSRSWNGHTCLFDDVEVAQAGRFHCDTSSNSIMRELQGIGEQDVDSAIFVRKRMKTCEHSLLCSNGEEEVPFVYRGKSTWIDLPSRKSRAQYQVTPHATSQSGRVDHRDIVTKLGDLEQSATFLYRCASVWKEQLTSTESNLTMVSEQQRSALIVDKASS